jgi:NAD(P)H-flavin reductase
MMRFVVRALEARGMAGSHIHVSLERNMQCGVALCGHCQLGPLLLCRDGPVLPHDRVAALLETREL